MKNNSRKTWAAEWFTKAADDELSAQDLLKEKGGSPNTICFLSQQMAEKYLKGYLIYCGKDFPKVHQLPFLRKLCEKHSPKFKKIKKETEFLTIFYIATRYPGEFPSFSFKDAEKAFKNARAIKELVLEEMI